MVLHHDSPLRPSLSKPYYLYAVDELHNAVSTTSLAASLYLVVVYLFAGHYAEAFSMLDRCFTDASALTEEERWVVSLVAASCTDRSCGALACRLRLFSQVWLLHALVLFTVF